MRLFLLIIVVMVAFAANSLLNRAALASGAMGPSSFAALRLISGALCLALMLRARGGGGFSLPRFQPYGMLSLSLYVLGFSFAYVSLPAGLGALILFGGVQITMFAGSVILREPIPTRRWLGALIAFAGLCWLLWPVPGSAVYPAGAVLMVGAAVGWGLYSLIGRRSVDGLADTAGNFIYAVPLGVAVALILPDAISAYGALLAVVSGAVTSGLGYALWYSVLPKITAGAAAVAQLSVPVIALLGGALLLGEVISAAALGAAAVVLGGIALSALPLAPRKKSSQGKAS